MNIATDDDTELMVALRYYYWLIDSTFYYKGNTMRHRMPATNILIACTHITRVLVTFDTFLTDLGSAVGK